MHSSVHSQFSKPFLTLPFLCTTAYFFHGFCHSFCSYQRTTTKCWMWWCGVSTSSSSIISRSVMKAGYTKCVIVCPSYHAKCQMNSGYSVQVANFWSLAQNYGQLQVWPALKVSAEVFHLSRMNHVWATKNITLLPWQQLMYLVPLAWTTGMILWIASNSCVWELRNCALVTGSTPTTCWVLFKIGLV